MTYSNETGYPSPSDILNPWIDKRWFKPEHSARGAAVHASISVKMKGVVPIWKPEFYGYRDSFNQISGFFEKPIGTEKRLTDKTLCYSGQIDTVAPLTSAGCIALGLTYPCTALVDWKTSANSAQDWDLRLAAYFNLCIVNGIECDIHLIARIRKDGSAPKIKVSHKEEIRFYFTYFKAALHSWYYFKTNVRYVEKKVLDIQEKA